MLGLWDAAMQKLGFLESPSFTLRSPSTTRQAWRATGWWPDHYSIAIFDISKVKGGSKLKFIQIGIPPHRYSGHYRGWIETYWTPMKKYSLPEKSARGLGPESRSIGQSGSIVRGFEEKCRRRLSAP